MPRGVFALVVALLSAVSLLAGVGREALPLLAAMTDNLRCRF